MCNRFGHMEWVGFGEDEFCDYLMGLRADESDDTPRFDREEHEAMVLEAFPEAFAKASSIWTRASPMSWRRFLRSFCKQRRISICIVGGVAAGMRV